MTLPALREIDQMVLVLRDYEGSAWVIGIALIWADLFLPVPQTTVIAALGIIYGVVAGGVLGTIGLVTGGLLGYGLMRTTARHLVARVVGERALAEARTLFDRSGAWAIVLSRSLPYSLPEVLVCLAGIAGMRVRDVLLALTLGSVPTAFVYAGIGAGWSDQPALALLISYVLPIACMPPAMYLMRRRHR